MLPGENRRGSTTFSKATTKSKNGQLERPNKASWIQKLVYHCGYGGQAKEGEATDHPGLSQIQVPGQRTTKVHRHLTCKRSCPVHFSVKQLYQSPDIACITFYSADHVNHGPLHSASLGNRFELAPHISDERRAWVQSEYLNGRDRPDIYVKVRTKKIGGHIVRLCYSPVSI